MSLSSRRKPTASGLEVVISARLGLSLAFPTVMPRTPAPQPITYRDCQRRVWKQRQALYWQRVMVRRFVREESGSAATEKAMLIALGLLLVAVVSIFAKSVASWFANNAHKITS